MYVQEADAENFERPKRGGPERNDARVHAQDKRASCGLLTI
jgi:hypothetical protein